MALLSHILEQLVAGGTKAQTRGRLSRGLPRTLDGHEARVFVAQSDDKGASSPVLPTRGNQEWRPFVISKQFLEGVFSEVRIYDPAVWERAVKGTEAALH